MPASTNAKPKKDYGDIEFPKDTRKFKLTLTYNELETLLQATHNVNATLIPLEGEDNPAEVCRRIRLKVIDLLNDAEKH
jgi:hypothetical protein